MPNRQLSFSTLKKTTLQRKLNSKLDSFLGTQAQSKGNQLLLQSRHQGERPLMQKQCPFNYLSDQTGESLEDGLSLYSKVLKQNKIIYIQGTVQLIRQSEELQPSLTQSHLELTLQNRIKTQKIKVHSSIDGMDRSKANCQNGTRQQKSISLSDLILSDNGYLKLSKQLNQHYSLLDSQEQLKVQHFQNIKTLEKQTKQKIQCIQAQLYLYEKDEPLKELIYMINDLQNQIFKLKMSNNRQITSPRQTYNKSRPKTPQICRVKSLKSQKLIKLTKSKQNLETNIYIQRQKVKRYQQESADMAQKLSKAKSDYAKMEIYLGQWQYQLKNSNRNSAGSNKFVRADNSPKIRSDVLGLQGKRHKNSPIYSYIPHPLNSSIISDKIKHYQSLQKHKIKYYCTLKEHVNVINQGIGTFKQYEVSRAQQLAEQIQLLKEQLMFIDMKSDEKFFYGSQSSKQKVCNKNQHLKEKPQNKSGRVSHENQLQKLVSTHQLNSLKDMGSVPPLGLRMSQLHSHFSKARLFSKSPRMLHSPTSISFTSRGRQKTTRTVDTTLNNTEKCAIKKKENERKQKPNKPWQQKEKSWDKQGKSFRTTKKNKVNRQNKQNLIKNYANDVKVNDVIVKSKQNRNQVQNQSSNLMKRKVFVGTANKVCQYDRLITQPQNEYCMKSENYFRF